MQRVPTAGPATPGGGRRLHPALHSGRATARAQNPRSIVRFRNAFVNAPLCDPSRRILLTSQHPHQYSKKIKALFGLWRDPDLLKTIWKMANPKPPKPPPKGSKKPPQPYYAEDCGFPSREEVEWALLGTRAEGKEGKPLDLNRAVELLTKLDTMNTARADYPGTTRTDVQWSLDVKRTERLLKVRPPAAAPHTRVPDECATSHR